MLRFKDGVSVAGLQAEILYALDRCVECWEGTNRDVTVTSGRGGKHSRQSKHYSGHAVDLRTRDLNESQISAVHKLLIAALPDFDVVRERDHIHLEYDPKDKHDYIKGRAF